MAKFLVFIIAVAAVSLYLSQTALAVGVLTSEREREYKDRIATYADSLRDQRVALETGEWDIPQVEQYLNTTMWYVYTAKVCADYRFDETVGATNDDLTKLVSLGFLPFWPDNPLRNWEPMKVCKPGDTFSEGDFCFAVCPANYASLGVNGLVRMSFDLYVYAPVAGFEQFGQISQAGRNSEWSIPPQGALYGLSFYAIPESERQELIRKYKEQVKAEQAKVQQD